MEFFGRLPLYPKASYAVSFAATLFGIGPSTTTPAFRQHFGHFSPAMHDVIVSSLLLPGTISALFGGILADRHGHIRLIGVGTTIYGVGAIVECAAPLLGWLGLGLFLSNVYVRGVMTAVPQPLIAMGIVAGYFIRYGHTRLQSTSLSWRLPRTIASGLAFINSAICWWVPSPSRWLVRQGRHREARQIAQRLGLDEVEQDELLCQPLDDADASVSEGSLLLRLPFYNGRFWGCFLMAFQQFSGIDGVLYYAPILSREAAVAIPATLLADRWGRRTSSIVGGCGCSTLMLIVGSMHAADQVKPEAGAGNRVVVASIYLYTFIFNGTWAIGFRTSLIESVPKATSSAAGLAQASNWVSNYLVALITPLLISQSSFGAYFLFVSCTALCTVSIIVFMPETKGHSLETIERMCCSKQPGQQLARLRAQTGHNGNGNISIPIRSTCASLPRPPSSMPSQKEKNEG
ncbi:sugar transport protein [Durotheca rogersii]|uniref:sugar transport protein n=1 Tax=Durotheca rogersii TaxID=419775 RepID=UPI00221F28CD|nr:sugar transport protein [Durotheca rogersii]KAI5863325.1 sugar transport protein [Durotheca rogersii]